MSKCYNCKHYHLEIYDGESPFNDEWCKIDNTHLHDDDCPNYEKELQK